MGKLLFYKKLTCQESNITEEAVSKLSKAKLKKVNI